MKKIFTLLACAAVAVSAVAMPKNATLDATKVKAACEKFTFNAQPVNVESDNAVQRVMTSGNGETTVAMIQNRGTLWDEEDLAIPIFLMQVSARTLGGSAANSSNYVCALMWPSYALLCPDDCWNENADEDDPNMGLDWDKANAYWEQYGKDAKEPVSIVDALAYVEKFYNGRFTVDNFKSGRIPFGFYMLPSAWVGATSTYKGTSDLAMADGSYFQWNSYDEATGDSEWTFSGSFGPAPENYSQVTGWAPTTTTATFMEKCSGAPTLYGFRDMDVEIGQVHVFNFGRIDSASEWAWAYGSIEPCVRYYAAWCTPALIFYGKYSNGEEFKAWEKTDFNISNQNCMPGSLTAETSRNWWGGAFFMPENATTIEGLFTMPEPKVTFVENAQGRLELESWESYPTPYELMVGYYDYGPCNQDGMTGILEYGWYDFPQPERTFIGFGDKTYGFNFRYGTNNTSKYEFIGNYTDSIYLHNNPNNFDEMSALEAIGSADANAINFDPTAVKVVESNSPVVGTQYFNLQGQRLNAAPQHGIFIQRDLKADGSVKAVKVVK